MQLEKNEKLSFLWVELMNVFVWFNDLFLHYKNTVIEKKTRLRNTLSKLSFYMT